MSYRTIEAFACTCEKCGHQWNAFELPKACGKCKSRGWNIGYAATPVTQKVATPVTQATPVAERPRHVIGCRCFMCKPPKSA